MQGIYGSENTSSLSELFTLVLITHNRPAFLRRALQFYSTLPCKILVLDSSAIALEGAATVADTIDYRHLPQFGYWGIQAKLAYGVEQVTTPYMVFASDDDFLLHGALTESVSFLEANPDYGLCHGYCLMYLTHSNYVQYYRRDKKVHEDYNAERGQDRVLDFMSQYIPPFYAVHRTSLLRDWYEAMPEGTIFQWQEIGHAYYMLARAKARILPTPYVVREVNYGRSDHNTEIMTTLSFKDARSVADRERFAGFLASLPTGISGLDEKQTAEVALQSFATLAESLTTRNGLTIEPIFESYWTDPTVGPKRVFGAEQYVEMPFYNSAFFEQLTQCEFLLHAMPAGRLQLEEMEGALLKQEALQRTYSNDSSATIQNRLLEAVRLGAFNRRVLQKLAQQLQQMDEPADAQVLTDWVQRLDSVPIFDSRQLLDTMPSGRLRNWLQARQPNDTVVRKINQHLAANEGGPQFGILLLDLDANMDKLQVTLDSLMESAFRAFKVVVFTTGDLPAVTTAQNTLHFVKVTAANYVDKLNQIARQSTSDWLLLAEAGDEFTAAGFLRASLELQNAEGCRAVAMDEIHRQANGTLVDVFRPAFNLDLLQSLPALVARHWLIRREALVEVGGFARELTSALEFDLLLRLIETGGLAGLAHLAEPLLITAAPELAGNDHERQTLVRHMATRGYQAQVSTEVSGGYRIDYRHAGRPKVSIIIHSQDNLEHLQRCLVSVLQRTRYQHNEIVIADNHSQSTELLAWLDSLEKNGAGRIRLVKTTQRLSTSALINLAAEQAQGEYLVLLAADAEVVNANWIEALLNQAQRPEVGVVGAKLLDREGSVTGAGLILGLNGEIASPFIGEKKEAPGYMRRLLVEQNYSAVSGACLMIRKEVFVALGGLDREHFDEVYADVDLCLKVADAGLLTVWTPQVQIAHPGVLPNEPQALAALRDKWQARFAHDEAYNNNLALTGKGFALGEPAPVNWAQLLA
ncbi:glycosyltransferase family 2 protein [Pseudomonas sp. ZB1P45]|uniref:glycosyltransferase family 2 protein n=1 Tax=Pseudomonas frigoris TaxID=3398356 RepID=UPI0039EEDD75